MVERLEAYHQHIADVKMPQRIKKEDSNVFFTW